MRYRPGDALYFFIFVVACLVLGCLRRARAGRSR